MSAEQLLELVVAVHLARAARSAAGASRAASCSGSTCSTTCAGSKSSMCLNFSSTVSLRAVLAGQLVLDPQVPRAASAPASTLLKLSRSISTNFRSLSGLAVLVARLARQVGQDADDERQLLLLHRAAGLHVVGDLDAGPPDAADLVLGALARHWARSPAGWDRPVFYRSKNTRYSPILVGVKVAPGGPGDGGRPADPAGTRTDAAVLRICPRPGAGAPALRHGAGVARTHVPPSCMDRMSMQLEGDDLATAIPCAPGRPRLAAG